MRGVGTTAAVAVAVLSVACAPTETAEQMQARMQEETEAFREAITAMQVRYEEWEAAGLVDSVASVYAENAVAAFPNQPLLRGRQAIRDNAEQAHMLGTFSLDLQTENAMANGPLAVERGSYVQGLTPGPNTPPGMAAMFPDSGSYVVHWHLIDDQWKIVELVVASHRPLPGMGM